jgi:ADP-ribose pyrophosphatase YjhB (NUDIX family)
VVKKPGERELTVRARARADLDRLRERYVPELGPTIAGGGTDYPYRALASSEALAHGFGKLVRAIDYSNFKDEVARVSGAARAKVCGEVWSAARKITGQEAPRPGIERPKAPPPAASGTTGGAAWKGATSFGGVVIDGKGRCLLVSPANHFGGYAWTFPKGTARRGEAPADAAQREVREESGVIAEIVAPVQGTFAGTTGASAYYLMSAIEETGIFDAETAGIRWVTPEEAEALIAQTPSAIGRKRDRAVLRAAFDLWRALSERSK